MAWIDLYAIQADETQRQIEQQAALQALEAPTPTSGPAPAAPSANVPSLMSASDQKLFAQQAGSSGEFATNPNTANQSAAQRAETARVNQVYGQQQSAAAAQWHDVAPGLPAGVITSFVQNNITPDSQLGQWAITKGQSALAQHKPLDIHSLDPQTAQAAQQLSAMGIASPTSSGSGFDAISKVARPAFAAMQAGYETLQAGVRAKSALPGVYDPTREAIESNPIMPANVRAQAKADITQGRFGTTVHGIQYGTQQQVFDLPDQLTIAQWALHGKSMGTGFFPSPNSPAGQAAADAQRAAASINGHALTPGRAAAALVFQPGSMPYQVMSGTVDFGVSMEADPASMALSAISDTVKGAHTFEAVTNDNVASAADHLIDKLGPTNASAIQDWAGPVADNADLKTTIVNKIAADPGSLQELVDNGTISSKDLLSAIRGRNAGLVDGLRRSVNPQNALVWLNSPAGNRVVQRFVTSNGLDIYRQSGQKIPAPVAWALGDATNEADVRSILGQAIGKTVNDVPTNYQWAHSMDQLRWFNKLPNYAVDSEDPNAMVQRGIQELSAGRVPKSQWNDLLRPLATAQDRTDAYQGFVRGIGPAVADKILEKTPGFSDKLDAQNAAQAEFDRLSALTPTAETEPLLAQAEAKLRQATGSVTAERRNARMLTTYFQQQAEEDRKFAVNAMGETPYAPGLALDDTAMPLVGPHLPSEMLNRAIPVIGGDGNDGIRNIKQAVSDYRRFWELPGMKGARTTTTYLADHLTQAFKVGALMRLALPVRFLADEQARMATAGVDSMFHHPISYLSYVINGGNAEDITGNKFIEALADHQSKVSQAIGRTSSLAEEIRGTDQIYTKGWGTFSRDNANYVNSWGDRLSVLHIDPIGNAVAKAIRDPESTGGLDAVKQSLWDGALSGERANLVKSDTRWGSANLVNRSQSDAYVDSVAQRINDMTGGQQDLIDALASGEPWMNGNQTSHAFRKVLSNYRDQEVGPTSVTGPIALDREKANMLKKATNVMFSALMSVPTSKLTRSPAFEQFYYKRAQELMPYLSSEDAATVAERAGGRLRMADRAAGEPISIQDADNIAKSYALKQTHDLLYYPSARSNIADNLRNVVPFGEAWKNVIQSWVKLTAENPVVLRRVQQGVTDARESGWWYKDPQDGVEKFTLVPGPVMQHLTGVPFPMVAPVKGLNIIGQGLPGVGPAISWPASTILGTFHNLPAHDFLQQKVLPYGNPDFAGGTAEVLFPGWWNKLKTTGWFTKVPFLGQSQDEHRILDNTAKLAMQYYMSTGKYNINDPESLAALETKSEQTAKWLYMWRGLAQFASPSAPQVIPQTELTTKSKTAAGANMPGGGTPLATLAGKKLKDGSTIETWMLAQDYQQMLKNAGGDSYAATTAFVNKYGADRVLNTGGGTYGEPYTQAKYFGLPTNPESEAWASNHAQFAKAYPTLFGYWANTQANNGTFDYNAYLQQIHDGQRTPLDTDTWVKLAEARLGNAVYSQMRTKVGTSPTRDQQSWLDNWKSYLTQQYPGFNQDQYKNQHDTLAQDIPQLQKAIRDPAVSHTTLAQTVGQYLDKRDQALATAESRGHTTFSGKEDADLRDWLYQWGTYMVQQHPEFQTMWDTLFLNEVQPPTNG